MGKNYDEEVAVHFVKAIDLQARRNIIATIRTAGHDENRYPRIRLKYGSTRGRS